MKKTKCHLCSKKSTKFFISKNQHGRRIISPQKFKVFICFDCHLVFNNYHKSKKYYEKYYQHNYYKNPSLAEKLISDFSLKLKIFKINNLLMKKGTVLDIGCGYGHFLQLLPKSYKKYGLEINKQAINYIKDNSKEITLLDKDINNIKSQGKFDIITLWHTLEHLDDIDSILVKINSLLKKNGYLIIATPNTNSLGFKIAKHNWFHLDCPRHLSIFNNVNIKNTLEKNRFMVKELKGNFIDYPLDFYWDVLSIFYGKKSIKIIASILIFIPALIARIFFVIFPSISETITVIAVKK